MQEADYDIQWNKEYTLPIYRPLYETDASIILVWGGRDSGKSYNIPHPLVAKSLQHEKFKCLLIRNVLDTVRDSIYAEVKGTIEEFGNDSDELFHCTTSPLEIKCINGSTFLGRGCDKMDKIKSVKEPSDAWIEEADQIQEQDFDTIFTTLRNQELRPTVWLSFNPETDPEGNNWIKDKFFTDQDGNVMDEELMYSPYHEFYINTEVDGELHRIKVLSIHSTFDDNPFATADRKAAIESYKNKSENKHNVWRYGYWGRRSTGKEWFSTYHRHDRGEIKGHIAKESLKYDPDLPLHLSYDQNNEPYMSCGAIQVKDTTIEGIKHRQVRILSEFCLSHPRNSTEEINRAIVSRYDPERKGDIARIFYYGDSTGKNHKAKIKKDDVRHHYDQVEKQLRRYLNNNSNRVVRKNPSLIKTRDFCISLFGGYYENLTIIIDPSCKNLIKDLENLKEDSNGGYVKQTKKNPESGATYEIGGHMADLLRYFLVEFFKGLFERIGK